MKECKETKIVIRFKMCIKTEEVLVIKNGRVMWIKNLRTLQNAEKRKDKNM